MLYPPPWYSTQYLWPRKTITEQGCRILLPDRHCGTLSPDRHEKWQGWMSSNPTNLRIENSRSRATPWLPLHALKHVNMIPHWENQWQSVISTKKLKFYMVDRPQLFNQWASLPGYSFPSKVLNLWFTPKKCTNLHLPPSKAILTIKERLRELLH